MRHKASVTVAGLALIGAGAAYAVPDSCDTGGGFLEGDILHRDLAQSDAFFAPDAAYDEFGAAVVTGDFDGDGRMDVAIGAPGADPNGNQSGAVYVFLTSDDTGTLPDLTDSTVADVILYGEQRADRTGYALGNAGDIDNDGRDDLLVGALSAKDPGIAHVVTGATLSASPGVQVTLDLLLEADYRIVGPLTGSEFGSALNGVGDINNDGTDDFVIGAPAYSGVSAGRGAAYVFYGGGFPQRDLFAGTHDAARIDGAINESSFGMAIEPAGDIQGDGFADFWIGSPRDGTAGTTAGAAYMFSGAGTIDRTIQAGPDSATVILYGRPGYRCGASIAYSPDLNGDDIEDAFIGCKQAGTFKKGAVYIMRGGPEGQAPIDILGGWNGWGESANTLAGSSLAVGDFNADGRPDVAIGGERGRGAVLGAGVAYVVHGPFSFLSNDPVNLGEAADMVIRGSADVEFVGSAMAAGDYDGDGIDDLFVSASKSMAHITRGGAVSYYRGGADQADLIAWYADADSDGFGSPDNFVMACDNDPPEGYVATPTDCDDQRNDRYPGAAEYCGDIDMNCDGFAAATPEDNDGDGYPACDDPNTPEYDADCNDGLAEINPGATELCNGIDDNCNGLVDDEDPDIADANAYYVDVDGDGYGFHIPIIACQEPTGLQVPVVTNGDDCDDNQALINPAAAEICGDNVDNNCRDGIDDGGAVDAEVFWVDLDGDTYGDPGVTIRACIQPSNYVQNRLDCDDTTTSIRPGQVETCDAQDNDCDGMAYMGGPFESVERAHATFLGEAAQDKLQAAGFLPDQDFDGRDELVLVAHRNDAGAGDGGAVYIKRGEVPGGDFDLGERLANGTYWYDTRIVGTRADAFFGHDVAVGDFNGDGTADLVVGAPQTRAPDLKQGAVYVFFGPIPDGQLKAEDAHVILRGEKAGVQLGHNVAMGDIDGDGYDDLITGSHLFNQTSPSQGKLYVVYGGASITGNHRIDTVASGWFLGSMSAEQLGTSIATADLDGDGFEDIVANAAGYNTSRGAFYIFYGSATRYANAAMTPAARITIDSGVNAQLANTVSNLGDVNGDGYDDLFVSQFNNGNSYLVLGRAEPIVDGTIASVTAVRFRSLSGQTAGRYGKGVGDVNQDGFQDFIIGAVSDDRGASNAGAAILVYGRESYDDVVVNGDFSVGALESFGRIDPVELLPDGNPVVHSALNYDTLEGASIAGEAQDDNLGQEIGGDLMVGDYDGDGVPDYGLSAINANRDDNATDAGKAYLFLGGRYGIDVFVTDESQETWYWDWDADQWTTNTTFESCMIHRPIRFRPGQTPWAVPRGLATPTNPLDCDDFDETINPGATETEGDGEDTDCDGYDNPNILPIVSVEIKPDPAKATDTLVAERTVIHEDTDGVPFSAITYEYRWYVNDVLVAGQVGSTLAPTHFKASDRVKVEFRADDTRGVTDWVSDDITIENTLPTLEACVVTPAAPGVGDPFTVTTSGLADVDVPDQPHLRVEYEWQLGTADAQGFQVITGESDTVLASCAARFTTGSPFNCGVGSQIRARCYPIDSEGRIPSNFVDAPWVTVQNSPPSVLDCRVTPVGAKTNIDLTAQSNGVDPDQGQAVAMTYRWFRNGVLIDGETGSTLSQTHTLHFDQIQVECTPHDPLGGVGEPIRSAPLTIENSKPGSFIAQLQPVFARSVDELFVSITAQSVDIDEFDVVSYVYEWRRNGQPFLNPTAQTSVNSVTQTATQKGDLWQVTIRAYDGYDFSDPVTLEVEIHNSPPSITGALILPAASDTSPESRQSLTAVAQGYFDPDGDAAQNRYQWYVNGTAIPEGVGGKAQTLGPQHFERGDSVWVTITPHDGEDPGTESKTSSAVTIRNSPPESVVLNPLTPNPAGYDHDLECTVATPASDHDGDSLTYTVTWWQFRPDNPFTAPNGSGVYSIVKETTGVGALTGAAWELGRAETEYADRYYCEVTPHDATSSGPTVQTSELAIQDLTKPGAPVVDIIEPARNTFTFRMKGECRGSPVECYDLHYECSDGTPNPVEGVNLISGVGRENTPKGCVNDEANPGNPLNGTFDFVETFPSPRGRNWTCRMWCTDIGNNVSLDSNLISTSVCSPEDVYDLAHVGGNDFSTAIDRAPGDSSAWPTMLDETAATRDVVGNIIGRTSISEAGQVDDTYDWYLFKTNDNTTNDQADQRNDYDFHAQLVEGAAEYDIQVFRYAGTGALPGAQQCPLVGTYDEYNYFNRDNWAVDKDTLPYKAIWHPHHHPYTAYNADGFPTGAQQPITDLQRCKAHTEPVLPPSAIYNDCNDMTANYYIRVNRTQPNANWNCSAYRLRVSMD